MSTPHETPTRITTPFPARVSPDRDAARQRNLSWARRHGLVDDAADETRYVSWDIADLMARWLPAATGPDLDLGVDALSFAAVLDDQFDGPLHDRPPAARAARDELAGILDTPELNTATSPLGQAFRDLWQRQANGRSPAWQRRAATHWRWFFEAFEQESVNRRCHTTPSLSDYLILRRRSGLVYGMLDLVEAAYGFETTPEDRRAPAVRRLLTLCADVIDTVNDIHSLAKEESRGDVHNVILIIQHESGLTRQEAIDRARIMVKLWCRRFIRIESQITNLPLASYSARLRLIAAMRDAMGGFPHWSASSARYTDLIPANLPAYRQVLTAVARREPGGPAPR
ncbi:hypothetical protein ACFWIA_12505 [Streptomyces sp. NPDC127068]|uniref:terpene synthase family protein n=1 Tax=Streptomyces sp. NPDC127068 TaxID=3347127 RepID=UPI003656E4B8